ncbi:Predicted membrane protein [Phaffia rhodozyma]|uniref:Predicted membrane protein n=1 Tax=Phaffia rhodozyma TaxID=264483 RepID=A0A0F7SPB8_PHARH|nr:Predicted membrane protein [Phaffia rhodozyma]
MSVPYVSKELNSKNLSYGTMSAGPSNRIDISIPSGQRTSGTPGDHRRRYVSGDKRKASLSNPRSRPLHGSSIGLLSSSGKESWRYTIADSYSSNQNHNQAYPKNNNISSIQDYSSSRISSHSSLDVLFHPSASGSSSPSPRIPSGRGNKPLSLLNQGSANEERKLGQQQEEERRRMGSWYFLAEVQNQTRSGSDPSSYTRQRDQRAGMERIDQDLPSGREGAYSFADSFQSKMSRHTISTPSFLSGSPRGDIESGSRRASFPTSVQEEDHPDPEAQPQTLVTSPVPVSGDLPTQSASTSLSTSPAFTFFSTDRSSMFNNHPQSSRIESTSSSNPPLATGFSLYGAEKGDDEDESANDTCSDSMGQTPTIRARRYSEAFPSFSASPESHPNCTSATPQSLNAESPRPALAVDAQWIRPTSVRPINLKLPPKPLPKKDNVRWWRKTMMGFSRQEVDVTKCAIAYFLASLFTFNEKLNSWLPNASNAHMIATIAVYYNPAKSVGAMVEADLFCVFVSAFSSLISLAAVGTIKAADAAGSQAGDWAALFFWMGGACAIMAWLKSWVGKPTFNSATSMGFLTMSIVIVKEGGLRKLLETLLNVLLGTTIANLTCLLIYPYSATSKLQHDINSTLTSFSTLLSILSQTFLLDARSSSEPITPESLAKAVEAHEKSFTLLKKNLAEAKSEFLDHRIQRTSESYDTVVSSLTRLAQHLTGLRSGTGLQYEILKAEREGRIIIEKNQESEKPIFSPMLRGDMSGKGLPTTVNVQGESDYFSKSPDPAGQTSKEVKDDEGMTHTEADATTDPSQLVEIQEAEQTEEDNSEEDIRLAEDANLLAEVREQVGPQIRALTTACNETLLGIRATFAPADPGLSCNIDALRETVSKTLDAFRASSSGSIMSLYDSGCDIPDIGSNNLNTAPKESAFLVFYFIFTLDEFTRELLFFIDSMSEIQDQERQFGLRAKSWITRWTRQISFWLERKRSDYSSTTTRKGPPTMKRTLRKRMSMIIPIDPSEYKIKFPNNAPDAPGTATNPDRKTLSFKGQFQHWVWELAERTRKPDIKYAIKVGLATSLLAAPAFTSTWRPIFYEYKGEWALMSFFTTMAPTEGQTNFLSLQRVLGTLSGAATAACVYSIFPENPIALPLFGFLFSLPCFWYIVTKPAHATTGRFVLLTYNLTALYSYNDRARDTPVWSIAYRRFTAVSVGVIFAFFVTRFWWPYAARRELSNGLSDFFIDLSYLYTRLIATFSEHQGTEDGVVTSDPLDVIAEEPNERTRLVIPKSPLSSSVREFMAMELHLQISLINLRSLMDAATKEPRFKGPFPRKLFNALIMSSQTILDRFHSIRCVVNREEWDAIIHRDFIEPVNPERREMTGNVLLYFSTISSAFKLKVPLSPYLPPAEEARVRLLMKIEDLEVMRSEKGGGARHLLFFSYVLAMAGVIKELNYIGSVLQDAYGVAGGSFANFEALFETPR